MPAGGVAVDAGVAFPDIAADTTVFISRFGLVVFMTVSAGCSTAAGDLMAFRAVQYAVRPTADVELVIERRAGPCRRAVALFAVQRESGSRVVRVICRLIVRHMTRTAGVRQA